MNHNASSNKISLATRVQLIKSFPCFAALTDAQSAELASALHEVEAMPNEKIVVENELVDSIYLIVSGEAEVTHEVKQRKKVIAVPVAQLHAGESIGLNDTGFYSVSGKRTATVVATTPMVLLQLDLKDLHSFLDKHNLESTMYAASLQMLRMHLIKQSLPFSKLSHERLQWLADHVEEMNVPAGTIIFKQGDQGDKCYLIRSGQVEILMREEGVERQIALLKPPVLFGEATLITHTPRNATARALEDCELLMLRHDNLSELIESESNVAYMFMNLMVDRSRPDKNPNVTLHTRTTADGQRLTILKNAQNGSYFKLSEEGAYIWEQLDGSHTLQDITLNLAEKFNIFAPDVVAALISKLTQGGFISNLDITNENHVSAQPLWVRLMIRARQILETRYAFGDADNWITKTYNKYVRYLFTRTGQIILAFLIVFGLLTFISKTDNVLAFFSHQHAGLLLILALIPLSLIEVLLHELGHAYAVKAFGREVHYIGVGWNWFAPIAFTDTSDMWLATRKPRMMVNLAGIYVDLLIAGIAALFILLIPNPYVQGMFWLFALYTYIGAFRMLSPLQEMDGYYFLMDWVEKNRLRQAAVIWLVKIFPKAIKNPALFREHIPEVSYWIACILFLILVSIVTLVVQTFIFSIIGIQSPNPYLSLILPFIVVLISSLSILAEIRNEAEE